eukprot:360533_1
MEADVFNEIYNIMAPPGDAPVQVSDEIQQHEDVIAMAPAPVDDAYYAHVGAEIGNCVPVHDDAWINIREVPLYDAANSLETTLDFHYPSCSEGDSMKIQRVQTDWDPRIIMVTVLPDARPTPEIFSFESFRRMYHLPNPRVRRILKMAGMLNEFLKLRLFKICGYYIHFSPDHGARFGTDGRVEFKFEYVNYTG